MSMQMGTKKGLALPHLGQLLYYPRQSYQAAVLLASISVSRNFPSVSKALGQFAKTCQTKSLQDLEEIYTSTFDLAAICSPYITGYIYGDESYDRGTLMAQFSAQYDEIGFDTNGELPDHLALVLCYASWLDNEVLDELITYCLLEPVKAMVEKLKDSTNPYFNLLSAVLILVQDKDGGRNTDD